MSPPLSVVDPEPPPPVLGNAFQNPLQPVRQITATARHAQKRDLMAAPSFNPALPCAAQMLVKGTDSSSTRKPARQHASTVRPSLRNQQFRNLLRVTLPALSVPF